VHRAIELNPAHCPSYRTLPAILRERGEKREVVIEALRHGLEVKECQQEKHRWDLEYDLKMAEGLSS
jgi:hypothetical protein